MEVGKRFKMIYITKMNKKLEKKIKDFLEVESEVEEAKSDNIRILGHYFVQNNENKAKLIINNKKNHLLEIINSKDLIGSKIKIKMILSKDISNFSYLFENCSKLIKFSIYNNIIKIIDEFKEEMIYYNYNNSIGYFEDKNEDFYNNFYKNLNDDCFSPDISTITKRDESKNNSNTIACIKDKLEIYHNYDISEIISNTWSLSSLSYKSKKKKINISNMGYMFYNCLLLSSLPDISKLNTSNVNDMSRMFFCFVSLKSLPDISKWNTNNVSDMSGMFFNCSSLSSLPDISNWNTNNVKNMCEMFGNCKSLKFLPDISKWNINNVEIIALLFHNCKSLLALPDISKWNTNNIIFMIELFSDCSSLLFQ